MTRALTSLALSAAAVLPVMAHEAPTGWRYGWVNKTGSRVCRTCERLHKRPLSGVAS